MKIIVPSNFGIADELKNRLAGMDVAFFDDPPSATKMIDRIKDAEILIPANYIEINAQVIDAAPKLKYIIVAAVGYEMIDIDYARSKGIAVLNCPTHNSQAVAEHAIALLLASCRQIIPANESMKRGEWDDHKYIGKELVGKTLGLIGYGNIGKKVESLATGIGISVSHINSHSTPQDIDDLVANSDIICVCAPLNVATKHLLDDRRLSLTKPNVIVINVSRGGLIDQEALIQMLLNNPQSSAGLDVFEDEPLDEYLKPSIQKLINLPNVVATPHLAYNTDESRKRLGQEVYDNVVSCLSEAPMNKVN